MIITELSETGKVRELRSGLGEVVSVKVAISPTTNSLFSFKGILG